LSTFVAAGPGRIEVDPGEVMTWAVRHRHSGGAWKVVLS
jgi:hypothetical protein